MSDGGRDVVWPQRVGLSRGRQGEVIAVHGGGRAFGRCEASSVCVLRVGDSGRLDALLSAGDGQ